MRDRTKPRDHAVYSEIKKHRKYAPMAKGTHAHGHSENCCEIARLSAAQHSNCVLG